MSLACQTDSYLRQLTTKVTRCETSVAKLTQDGKSVKVEGYDVVLEDTVLFPEGGGQPDDRGTINGKEVLRVMRKGADVFHFVTSPLDPGTEVTVEVDWKRRWDHMQQHSGQHLLSALMESLYNVNTTSWWLGEKTCFVELDMPNIKSEQMQEVESLANEKIRQRIEVTVTLDDGTGDSQATTRGLPSDHVGPVRVITIGDGIDANMCCGTHVRNLCDLQAIKLLGVDKGKKGKIQLGFVVGNRVLDILEGCLQREKALTGFLKSHPEQHADLVDKLQTSYKVAQKHVSTLLKDVVVLEAERFRHQDTKDSVLVLHRKEGDIPYMLNLVNELNDEKLLAFLTTGNENGAGFFLLAGPEKVIEELGPKVEALIQGKGAGKKGRYQGKASKLSKRKQVEKLLRDYVESHQNDA